MMASSPHSVWAISGHGSQKAEEELARLIPAARIARIDSDTVQDPARLPEILGKFREGAIDILVGTQILAKGHDFPKVTLICVLEVDQLLGLPDFRGGERTFQLLVQASGRAGRGEIPGRVLIQSMRLTHPVVQQALTQDYAAFAQSELQFRHAMGYPPFGKMILIELNGDDATQLDRYCAQIEELLDQKLQQTPDLMQHIKILGPSPAAIEVIRGRTRRQFVIVAKSYKFAREVAQWVTTSDALKIPHGVRMKIDVDPQSTL